MDIQIHNEPLTVRLFGASLTHDATKGYGQEIRQLLDRVWQAVRSRNLSHQGINWVLYEADGRVFAGVEFNAEPPVDAGLEARDIRFNHYALYKHIGPYDKLGDAYAALKMGLQARHLTGDRPAIERYGHWTEDVTKLETDLVCPVS